MAREIKDVTIGEHKYTFGHWDPDHGLSMFTRLIKMVGEPLAKVLVGASEVAAKGGGLDADIKEEDYAVVVGDLMSSLGMRLQEDEVKTFFRDAQRQLTCDGKQPTYEVHYAGRIGHLMLVTKAQCQHQFSDFLELLPGKSLG